MSNKSEPEQYSGTCFRCGECCTRYQVLMEMGEMKDLANYLGIGVEEFKTEYTDPRWPVPGKYLLKHRDKGGCIFLVRQGKEALCSVHVAKPRACRDWSPSLDRKECGLGLANVWGLGATQGGELCGSEHDIKTFVDYLKSIES